MPTIRYKKQNAVYVAVEKCAITRLIRYFGTTYKLPARKGLKEEIWFPADKIWSSNEPLSKVKQELKGEFIFAFIRNPFDRVLSNYFFNSGKWKKRFGKPPTFEEYVKNMIKWNDLKPITFYIDIPGAVNFYGRYENFKEDFDRLHDILEIEKYWKTNDSRHPLITRLNGSRWARTKTDYRDYYNNTTREIIEHKYKEDLKEFDYKF